LLQNSEVWYFSYEVFLGSIEFFSFLSIVQLIWKLFDIYRTFLRGSGIKRICLERSTKNQYLILVLKYIYTKYWYLVQLYSNSCTAKKVQSTFIKYKYLYLYLRYLYLSSLWPTLESMYIYSWGFHTVCQNGEKSSFNSLPLASTYLVLIPLNERMHHAEWHIA
jgi:hypothetical protein